MVMGIGEGNEIYEPTLLLTDFTGLVAKPEESGVVARPESEKKKQNKNKKRKRRGGLQSESTLRCSSPPKDPSVLKKPELDVSQALRLKGTEACKWFARQLMLPEWMIDVPDNLNRDWYVLARPAGKRCLVVSSNGTTVSRVRDGSILHHFPSALPSGAWKKDTCVPAQSYSILDCIFHEADQTYYVIDIVCWKGYSLYECTAELRLFGLETKLAETGACDPPSYYHKFRFSAVPFYNCDQKGLHSAYTGTLPYVKDGLLFFNKHAHYHTGKTPQVLIWKDDKCSEYVIDTDSNGEVPKQQHSSGLSSGSLVRFAIGDGADLQYMGVSPK